MSGSPVFWSLTMPSMVCAPAAVVMAAMSAVLSKYFFIMWYAACAVICGG